MTLERSLSSVSAPAKTMRRTGAGVEGGGHGGRGEPLRLLKMLLVMLLKMLLVMLLMMLLLMMLLRWEFGMR